MLVTTTTMLDARGIVKKYGDHLALAGLDLKVIAGEFIVLLGPNGAGKSTLFQILSGLFQPDSGDVFVNGFNSRDHIVQTLRDIGIVFQQSTLDLDLSVEANLVFHARLHGLNKNSRQQRIEHLLARFDMQERRSQPVRQLSGGLRRKVELARALIHEPKLLLMDEPTVGLDPPSRRELLHEVHNLCNERGVATLWATHLVDEAENANRVVVLHKGHKLSEGKPIELIRATKTDNLQDAFLHLINALGR